jgi:hypothetical protein
MPLSERLFRMTTWLPRSRAARLAFLLVAAAAIRLFFFTGLALGDDVFYLSAAAALVDGQGWPPLPLHWHTRLGITLPTAAGIALFGWHPLVIVWLPLVASLASVWLSHHIAGRVAGTRAAWIAGVLTATFPMEVIYSTHLFPDLVVGVTSAAAVWLWVRGLQENSGAAFAGAGAAFAAAYLCRETALILAPVFLALWMYYGRLRRPQLLWAGLAPLVVVLLESGAYAVTAGDPLYRWSAMLAQQKAAATVAPAAIGLEALSATVPRFVSVGWERLTRVLAMIVASHEFGVVHAVALPLACFALWRRPGVRWIAVWLLVGVCWTYYGTTVPTRWLPLYTDPRYSAPFTIPAVVLLSCYLASWRTWPRVIASILLAASGLIAASMDQRGSLLTPHRAFLESEFAGTATLEPFEYYGARWVAGFGNAAAFACAADAGRQSVVKLARAVPDAQIAAVGERRYFVFSPERRRDLWDRMAKEGWQLAAEIEGTPAPTRELLASMLQRVPGPLSQLARIGRSPRLVVLEHSNRPSGLPRDPAAP